MSPKNRKPIQRCQYGVFDPYSSDQVYDCGEPSVAVWDWGTGSLYVCEKHDLKIEQSELEEQKELNNKKIRRL